MLKEFAPMNTAELMDRAMDVYKRSFWKQIAFAAVLSVIAIAAMFGIGLISVMVGALLINALPIPAVGSEYVIVIAVILLMALPILLWQSFANAGYVVLAKQAFYGEVKIRVPHYQLPKTALRVFTVMLAQLLVAVPLVIILVLLVIWLAPIWDVSGDGFFIVTGILFLLAIIAVYLCFTNIFSVALVVSVFEGRLFFGAVARAWFLIKDDFWWILGVRVLWYLVIAAISFAAQGMVALIEAAWHLLAGTVNVGVFMSPSGAFVVIGFIVTTIVTFAVAPMDGIMQTMIYFNQRIRKEGFDIEIQLEKLSQTRAYL